MHWMLELTSTVIFSGEETIDAGAVVKKNIQASTRHTVAALPRWEPEPETVNRKGLQVTKSLEASPALKKLVVGGLKGPC
jgi:hypothetical protein